MTALGERACEERRVGQKQSELIILWFLFRSWAIGVGLWRRGAVGGWKGGCLTHLLLSVCILVSHNEDSIAEDRIENSLV